MRQGERAPLALVRRAFDAIASRELCTLERLVHPELEFRPVDGLGLVGETVYGFGEVRSWLESGGRRFARNHAMRARALEQLDDEHVLAVGVVSERGRTGGAYAATVAWIWHVRGGRIHAFHGYPSEADARRAVKEPA